MRAHELMIETNREWYKRNRKRNRKKNEEESRRTLEEKLLTKDEPGKKLKRRRDSNFRVDNLPNHVRGYGLINKIDLVITSPLLREQSIVLYNVTLGVKFKSYPRAVCKALLDKVPDEETSVKTTVLMVVGAGRGPLVRASLQATEETGQKLKVYAVEKNPNAVVTLHVSF
ncbi:hypothetical protein RIF29_28456 [Crotalaria pallida]|uniref:PRMT5 arginine-N-methyltransferase domain-containing protein n=1 Tax=Crotalaria pallida TaxID=3830 RepID=A0AAN9HVD2_CROPI